MIRLWRRFVVVFVVLCLIGGTTSQLARSSEYSIAVIGMPCDMALSAGFGGMHAKPASPCKTMTIDCIKQLGLGVVASLAARPASLGLLAQYSAIGYWASSRDRAGLSPEPEPLPPRTT